MVSPVTRFSAAKNCTRGLQHITSLPTLERGRGRTPARGLLFRAPARATKKRLRLARGGVCRREHAAGPPRFISSIGEACLHSLPSHDMSMQDESPDFPAPEQTSRPPEATFETRFEQFYLQLSEGKTGGMVVSARST